MSKYSDYCSKKAAEQCAAKEALKLLGVIKEK